MVFVQINQWLQALKCYLLSIFLYRRKFTSSESFLQVLFFNCMLRNLPWLKLQTGSVN